MGMPEPVYRRCRVDTGACGSVLQDVIDGALGERLPWPTHRTEHGSRCRRIAAAGEQASSDLGRDQHLPHLVALADHLKLRFPAVATNDLAPCAADQLRD